MSENKSAQLDRSLGLYAVTTIVIGSVIGSGIFVSAAGMARNLKSGWLLLLAWAIGGLFTLFGALTQSELIAQIPKTGGLFYAIREVYGELAGFLFGWANFAIAGSGAIAGMSFVCANYLGEFVSLPRLSPTLEAFTLHLPLLGDLHPLADMGTKGVAAVIMILLTFVNILGVRTGALLQTIATSSKVLALAAVIGIVLVFGGHQGSWAGLGSIAPGFESLRGWGLFGAMGMALSGAFWAYDGWGNVAFLGGEIREPEKNIPRGIVIGTLAFIGLYLLVNVAYLYILPVNSLGSVPGDRIATEAVSRVVGPLGAGIVASLIILCTFDATNSTILTNARVYWAMAQERVFPESIGRVHPRFHSPDAALILQCLWSLVLLVTGSFDIIFSMYVFVNWLIYLLMAIGVFVLRYRRARDPQATARPFSIPGYPYVPGLFVIFSFAFLIVTLVADIKAYRAGETPLVNSAAGLVLVFAGLPLYVVMRRVWLAKQKPAIK